MFFSGTTLEVFDLISAATCLNITVNYSYITCSNACDYER